jgi:hypothetical protein
MMAHAFPADPTLEALRVQRDAYTASGGEAAVVYDKLREELVVAKQRLSDQEKWLATARLNLRTAMEAPQGRQGETLVQPPNHADTTEATGTSAGVASKGMRSCSIATKKGPRVAIDRGLLQFWIESGTLQTAAASVCELLHTPIGTCRRV